MCPDVPGTSLAAQPLVARASSGSKVSQRDLRRDIADLLAIAEHSYCVRKIPVVTFDDERCGEGGRQLPDRSM